MPERKLKNYSLYMDRLLLFAEATGLKVEHGELDSEGVWMPSVKKIKLDCDLSQSGEIASFLHELGHSLDDIFSVSFTQENALYKAYRAVYDSKPSRNQLKMVLDCEKKAWNNGRDIAKRLKIPLGKWFDQAEAVCLKSYKDN